MRSIIVKQAVLLMMIVLAACVAPASTSPLPTPTTVAGDLLPVELIAAGSICEHLENEYQLFFVTSEEEWDNVSSELQAKMNPDPNKGDITEAIKNTNFQTHGIIIAQRTCRSSGTYSIEVAHVVEMSPDELYVYLSLLDPGPEHGADAMQTGRYSIVRVPWSQDNSKNPTVNVVVYTQLLGLDE